GRLAGKVAMRGGTTQTVALRELDEIDAFGMFAVEVARTWNARLLRGFDPFCGDGIARADFGNVDRAPFPAPFVGAAFVVLEPAKVGEHAVIIPPGRAEPGPVVVVPLVAADEHHAVDGGAAAEP